MAKLSEFQFLDNEEKEKQIKDKFDIYKDMSKEQLNNELLKEVKKQKENGSFDFNALSNMVENLRGILPASEYENIRRILENLK